MIKVAINAKKDFKEKWKAFQKGVRRSARDVWGLRKVGVEGVGVAVRSYVGQKHKNSVEFIIYCAIQTGTPIPVTYSTSL